VCDGKSGKLPALEKKQRGRSSAHRSRCDGHSDEQGRPQKGPLPERKNKRNLRQTGGPEGSGHHLVSYRGNESLLLNGKKTTYGPRREDGEAGGVQSLSPDLAGSRKQTEKVLAARGSGKKKERGDAEKRPQGGAMVCKGGTVTKRGHNLRDNGKAAGGRRTAANLSRSRGE